jgi:hypothetical protein
MKNWKALVAALLLIALIGFTVFDWSRFLADFWPLDASRVGPNLVAAVVQTAIVLGFVALVYPPTRRWIEEHLERLHAKVDHVILNTKQIPNEVPGLPSEHQPRTREQSDES